MAISELSVSLAPLENTGTVHTVRGPVMCAARFITTMSIGSALSVIATRSEPMSVGVVPEPRSVWPGLSWPVLGYVSRHVTTGVPSAPVSKRYMAPSVTT